jgi:hypothetical protein
VSHSRAGSDTGLGGGVVEAAAPAVLIAPAGHVEGRAARPLATGPRAVAVAAITSAPEEDDLAALRACADDEPERVHAPPRARRGGGQS